MRASRAAVTTAALVFLALCGTVLGAVHVYKDDSFSVLSDARVFKAGYEGMFRSREHAQLSVVTPKQQGSAQL